MAVEAKLVTHDVLHHKRLLQNGARQHLQQVFLTLTNSERRELHGTYVFLNGELDLDTFGVGLSPDEASVYKPHLLESQ